MTKWETFKTLLGCSEKFAEFYSGFADMQGENALRAHFHLFQLCYRKHSEISRNHWELNNPNSGKLLYLKANCRVPSNFSLSRRNEDFFEVASGRARLLGEVMLLAAAGVFGVVSYSVASPTKEFGVRAALGASPASIGRMILMEGLGLGAIGLGLGLAAALGLARFVKSELYGVTVYDPATFVGSAGVLLAVAIVACYIPARRAMGVDPMIALRCE